MQKNGKNSEILAILNSINNLVNNKDALLFNALFDYCTISCPRDGNCFIWSSLNISCDNDQKKTNKQKMIDRRNKLQEIYDALVKNKVNETLDPNYKGIKYVEGASGFDIWVDMASGTASFAKYLEKTFIVFSRNGNQFGVCVADRDGKLKLDWNLNQLREEFLKNDTSAMVLNENHYQNLVSDKEKRSLFFSGFAKLFIEQMHKETGRVIDELDQVENDSKEIKSAKLAKIKKALFDSISCLSTTNLKKSLLSEIEDFLSPTNIINKSLSDLKGFLLDILERACNTAIIENVDKNLEEWEKKLKSNLEKFESELDTEDLDRENEEMEIGDPDDKNSIKTGKTGELHEKLQKAKLENNEMKIKEIKIMASVRMVKSLEAKLKRNIRNIIKNKQERKSESQDAAAKFFKKVPFAFWRPGYIAKALGPAGLIAAAKEYSKRNPNDLYKYHDTFLLKGNSKEVSDTVDSYELRTVKIKSTYIAKLVYSNFLIYSHLKSSGGLRKICYSDFKRIFEKPNDIKDESIKARLIDGLSDGLERGIVTLKDLKDYCYYSDDANDKDDMTHVVGSAICKLISSILDVMYKTKKNGEKIDFKELFGIPVWSVHCFIENFMERIRKESSRPWEYAIMPLYSEKLNDKDGFGEWLEKIIINAVNEMDEQRLNYLVYIDPISLAKYFNIIEKEHINFNSYYYSRFFYSCLIDNNYNSGINKDSFGVLFLTLLSVGIVREDLKKFFKGFRYKLKPDEQEIRKAFYESFLFDMLLCDGDYKKFLDKCTCLYRGQIFIGFMDLLGEKILRPILSAVVSAVDLQSLEAILSSSFSNTRDLDANIGYTIISKLYERLTERISKITKLLLNFLDDIDKLGLEESRKLLLVAVLANLKIQSKIQSFFNKQDLKLLKSKLNTCFNKLLNNKVLDDDDISYDNLLYHLGLCSEFQGLSKARIEHIGQKTCFPKDSKMKGKVDQERRKHKKGVPFRKVFNFARSLGSSKKPKTEGECKFMNKKRKLDNENTKG